DIAAKFGVPILRVKRALLVIACRRTRGEQTERNADDYGSAHCPAPVAVCLSRRPGSLSDPGAPLRSFSSVRPSLRDESRGVALAGRRIRGRQRLSAVCARGALVANGVDDELGGLVCIEVNDLFRRRVLDLSVDLENLEAVAAEDAVLGTDREVCAVGRHARHASLDLPVLCR